MSSLEDGVELRGHKEAESLIGHVRFTECDRVNRPGAMFGPVPRFGKRTWLTEFLESNACEPAPSSRTHEVVVEEGLLISGETGRWYPIRNFIPELLPDHLRNLERDMEFLSGLRPILPPALFERLYDPKLFPDAIMPTKSEITISGRRWPFQRKWMTQDSSVRDTPRHSIPEIQNIRCI